MGKNLPLPLGEVAERSEVGEGKRWLALTTTADERVFVLMQLVINERKTLSVTFGDSSPRGRAKGNAKIILADHLMRKIA